MIKKALSLCVVGLVLIASASSQDVTSRQVYTVAPVEGGFTVAVGGASYGPYTAMSGTPWFSQDGAAWGMVLRKPDATTVVLVNGQEKPVSKDYGNVMGVSLSPDGAHWAVHASLTTNDRARNLLLVDGKAYGPFEQVNDLTWAPAGAGWYYPARTGNTVTVYREGKKYGPLPDARDFAWDAAGKRLAFTENRSGSTWVRVDDKEYGPYAEAGLVRAGNGSFVGWYDKLASGNSELTISDKKYGPYSYLDWGREYVSADGKDWLVMVFKGAKRILLQNGRETELGRLSVYKLAKGWMYTYEKNNGEYVVFNGVTSGPFDTGRNLTVMRDGSSWAISHLKSSTGGDKPYVTVNGKEYAGTALSDVVAGTGAADSAGAAGSTGAAVVTSAPAPEYFSWVSGGVDTDAVYQRFTTTLASTTLYSLTRANDGLRVSAAGSTWGPYREIAGNPWCSPDGAHWGLVARTDDTHFVTLVDGKESAAFGPYARAYDFAINAAGTGWSFTALPNASAPDSILRVVNGVEYGPLGWADHTWFSQDGKGFWFAASTVGTSPSSLFYLNGKAVGPFKGDFERRFFDIEAGVYALVSRASNGVSIRVNDDTFGPFQDIGILRVGGTPDDNVGRYFGFVATLKDNRRELHVQGGGTFGPYRSMDFQRMWISADGKSWMVTARKDGDDNDLLLRDGVETPTSGVDLRPWGASYLYYTRHPGAEIFAWAGGSAGPYTGVLRYLFSRDGASWAAEAWTGEGPSSTNLVIVNGKEYPGQDLRHVDSATAEYFTWLSTGDDRSGVLNTVKLR